MEPKDTILAKNKTLPLDTQITHLNNNIMLVGASGRGKTRDFVKPNILQMNSNYIISDPKGTLITEVGNVLKKNGYKIKIFNLLDLKHSNRYNPFAYIRCDVDVYSLIDFIIINTHTYGTRGDNPFWDKCERALLASLMFYLTKYRPKEEQNFTSIMKLLRAAEVDENGPNIKSPLDRIFDEVERRDLNSIALKQYRIFKMGAGKTMKSILISLAVRLQYFNIDDYILLTSNDNIELEKISDEKTALFIITSDTDPSKNWLAGVMYSQLFKILCERSEPCKKHIRFILDDFVCCGKIPDFDYKMAIIRSRNLSAVIIIQDEAQLEKEYDKASQGIISNCDTYIFLGATNIEACNIAAKRLGKLGITGTKIRRLAYDKCLVIVGDGGGIYSKFDLTKHEEYFNIPDGDERRELIYNYTTEFDVNVKDYEKISGQKNQISIDCMLSEILSPLNEFGIENAAHESTTRYSLFDSNEEIYFYKHLQTIENVKIFPHQHLRDIFDDSNISDIQYRKKITNMHCDFILRNEELEVLCGIEIDGLQHNANPNQIMNDKYKDALFKCNNIPLYRFSAEDIRKNVGSIINKLKNKIENDCGFKLYIKNKLSLDYKEFYDKEGVYKVFDANKCPMQDEETLESSPRLPSTQLPSPQLPIKISRPLTKIDLNNIRKCSKCNFSFLEGGMICEICGQVNICPKCGGSICSNCEKKEKSGK